MEGKSWNDLKIKAEDRRFSAVRLSLYGALDEMRKPYIPSSSYRYQISVCFPTYLVFHLQRNRTNHYTMATQLELMPFYDSLKHEKALGI
ncbi:hypothetical protein ACEPPN_005769 [Leptodophora sp. 'Broadleaf-Isolate-01']